MDSQYSEKENLKTKLTRQRTLWRLSRAEELLAGFSAGERLLLYALGVVLALSAFVLIIDANAAVSVTVPARGSSLTEGEVGPARFINPLLTLSQPDEDLTELIYSGLTRAEPDGQIIPDLASSFQISQDGTTYTFTLRPDAKFQDGTPVTPDDVVFTIQEAQNPDIKSIHRADWDGVVVSTPDAHTIVFKLPHAYAPFIENTTLGVLPKHLWQNVNAEEFPFSPLNTHPIGGGPYKLLSVSTDSTGAATRYDLAPFDGYALGSPYLQRITFRFYPNDDAMMAAFNSGEIDAIAGIAPETLSDVKRTETGVVRTPLPRVFGVFFNQGHAPVLADASVRAALDAAIDKDAIVNSVLGGYGTVLDGPVPPGVSGAISPATPTAFSLKPVLQTSSATSGADVARSILTKGGWVYASTTNSWTKKVPKSTSPSGKLALAFSLATVDQPQLVATANQIADAWKAIGVTVDVRVYPLSDLNTNVIRPRSYDAILFGEVVGRSMDLFAFWHSSQRNDPGLNLALYTNSKADSLLTQARATIDKTARDNLYQQFAQIVAKDQPAIFLYAPDFLYLVPKTINEIQLGALTIPAERFLNIYQWYSDTQRVWSIFAPNTNNQ